MNSRRRLHCKKKSTPLVQRPPIIDISSSSSSCSDKSVECSSLQNSSKQLDFHSTVSSSDDSELVYDWLATLNQSMSLSSNSVNRATSTPSHTVSTPTAKTVSTLNSIRLFYPDRPRIYHSNVHISQQCFLQSTSQLDPWEADRSAFPGTIARLALV